MIAPIQQPITMTVTGQANADVFFRIRGGFLPGDAQSAANLSQAAPFCL